RLGRKWSPTPTQSLTWPRPTAAHGGRGGRKQVRPGNRLRKVCALRWEFLPLSVRKGIRYRPSARGGLARSGLPDRENRFAPESPRRRGGEFSASRILPGSACPVLK